ncbi:hypothetical protein IT570_00595 [Candidatus Sumerlaeota bacterium]|nr:hypothetical protein [Candidatus Sumerlaeota bacterium]
MVNLLFQVRTLATAAFVSAAVFVSADSQTIDFETPNQLNDAIFGGDKKYFTITNEQSDGAGSQSFRFDYTTPDAFQSFTYDLPITIGDGTISLWFYDSVGAAGGPFPTKFGGSIILEDANSPADFLAVEIWDGPYPPASDPTPGAPNYFLSRGTSTPTVGSSFNSRYFGDRSVGWHNVVFTLSGASSTVSIDGISNSEGSPTPLTGPGTTGKTLRLRFMAWSPTNDGSSNWTIPPTPTYLAVDPDYVRYDDFTFTATTPSPASATQGFEGAPPTAEFDIASSPMVSGAVDNPLMHGFVPAFTVTTDQAHEGTQSAKFANQIPIKKGLTVDLSTIFANAGITSGQVSFRFYDSFGGDTGFDKMGGTVLVESVSDPTNYIGFEIWNGPYPTSDFNGGNKNYYAVRGGTPPGTPPVFFSNYFGDRSVGWHTVNVDLDSATSKFTIDGVENLNTTGLRTGPGLGTPGGIRLRFMIDSASVAGGGNYALNDELNQLYDLVKTPTYLYYDNLTIPVATSVQDWTVY